MTVRSPICSGVPGVSSLATDGQVVRCHVRGSVAPLLTALAGANVTELLSREPSLEELFLAQYGGDGDAAGRRARVCRAELGVRSAARRRQPLGRAVGRAPSSPG